MAGASGVDSGVAPEPDDAIKETCSRFLVESRSVLLRPYISCTLQATLNNVQRNTSYDYDPRVPDPTHSKPNTGKATSPPTVELAKTRGSNGRTAGALGEVARVGAIFACTKVV